MGIRSGLLDTEIKIYKPRDTVNRYGEKVTDYFFYTKTRARVMLRTASRGVDEFEITNRYVREIQIRRYVNIYERDIVEIGGERYRVVYRDEKRLDNYKMAVIELINE